MQTHTAVRKSESIARKEQAEDDVARCLSDVLQLLALPSRWSGKSEHEILTSASETLEALLPVDVIEAGTPGAAGFVQIARIAGRDATARAEQVRGWFGRHAHVGASVQRAACGELGELVSVCEPLSVAQGGGRIVVASRSRGFPSVSQLLIIKTAACLTATALETVAAATEREAALRAKDEFLAVLGHELRNPLAPIVNALDLMQMRKSGFVSREEQVMRRQVDHLTRLVDDLMDISKISRGLLVLHTTKVELSEVVREAAEVTAPLVSSRGHQLSLRVPAHGLPVDADKARLVQVIANLLSNAAKFTQPGGCIGVEAALRGSRVELIVRDSGSGIEPELLPRVFERFVHGRAQQEPQQSGLGIGLSIVRALVELHGGRVSAASAGAGQGSQFTIELPLADADDEEPSPPSVNVPSVDGRESGRILVLDDNADAAELLGDALALAGYEVRVERDSRRALSVAVDFQPHLAILDIGMPELSGYDVAERMQSLLHPLPMLIALSGYGQPQDLQRSKVAGFVTHLVKPVEMPSLLELVASLLRNVDRHAVAVPSKAQPVS